MEWLKHIDLRQLPFGVIFAGLFFIAGFMLAAPPHWLGWMHLQALVADYGQFIGLTLLLSAAYGCVRLTLEGSRAGRRFLVRRKEALQVQRRTEQEREESRQRIRRHLQLCSDAERWVLREALHRGSWSLTLGLAEGVWSSLLQAGLFVTTARVHLGFARGQIPEQVWALMVEEPSLVAPTSDAERLMWEAQLREERTQVEYLRMVNRGFSSHGDENSSILMDENEEE